MSERLVQVTAPHFCAGMVLRDGHVVRAAPILKWTVGKSRLDLRDYFDRKGWSARFVGERP